MRLYNQMTAAILQVTAFVVEILAIPYIPLDFSPDRRIGCNRVATV